MDLLEPLANLEITEEQNTNPTYTDEIDETNETNETDEIDETKEQIFENIVNGRINYTKWVGLLGLYKVICSSGGMIFGGAPRDYIKRTTASKKFYEYFTSQNLNKLLYKKNYNDKKCNEETYEDRTLLPNDIDVYITEDNYTKLIKKLGKEYYIYNSKSKKHVCYFLETIGLFRDALEYNRCYINFLKPKSNKLISMLVGDYVNNTMKIKIDFVVLKNSHKDNNEARDGGLLYPPFGNPDFDVNQLGMFMVDDNIEIKVFNSLLKFQINTYSGQYTINPIEIMDIKSRVLKEVIDNIINWVAVPVFPDVNQIRKVFGDSYQPNVNFLRADKMADKGYCINGEKTIAKIKYIKCQPLDYVSNEDDKCIICLDIFTETRKWFAFGCNCNVKMHLECYAKYIRNPTIDATDNILCPHCRSPNQNVCPCIIMNFMSSLNHWCKLTDSDKVCIKCIQNNYNDQCLKWYYQCRVCAI
jgi:hypothetical protein